MTRWALLLVALSLALAGCDDDVGLAADARAPTPREMIPDVAPGADEGPPAPDATATPDAAAPADAAGPADAAPSDLGLAEDATPAFDMALEPDAAPVVADMAVEPPDMSPAAPDMALAAPDMGAEPDLGRLCPGGRVDCGGGACFDLDSDIANCGACGRDCRLITQNVTGLRCEAGVCAWNRCVGAEGNPEILPDGSWNSFMNCDGDRENGCEEQRRIDMCRCGRICEPPDECDWDQPDDRWLCD